MSLPGLLDQRLENVLNEYSDGQTHRPVRRANSRTDLLLPTARSFPIVLRIIDLVLFFVVFSPQRSKSPGEKG
jgi:hypothetical protein